MSVDEIEKLQRRIERKIGQMTPNQRRQYLTSKQTGVANTLARLNRLLAEIGCMGIETGLSVGSSPKVRRIKVYSDPKIRALPHHVRIPKFPQLIDITGVPEKRGG